MNIYETVKDACRIRGVSVKKLEEDSCMGKRTMYNWATSAPAADKLLKVAKYLDTSMEYLMGETDDIDAKISTQWEGLAKDEAELLSAYRKLNSEGKQRILGDSVSFTMDKRYKKDGQNIETA